MQKNKNGFTLIILIVVLLIISLAYFLSKNGPAVFVKNYFTNPQEVSEDDLQVSYEKALEAAKKVVLTEMPSINESDYFQGNLDAPVKIIYYSDFECPFCPSFIDNLEKVKEDFPDKVVIAFRHFILSNHTQALGASLAAECATEQGQFWEMHNRLYKNVNNQIFGKEQYLADAEAIGLDTKQFEVCLDSKKYLEKIENAVDEAKAYGVSGVPSVYINGKSYPGAYPYENFTDQSGVEQKGLKAIVEEELENM